MGAYLTPDQLAKLIPWSSATIRRRLHSGAIRGTNVQSRVWLIPAEEAERLQRELSQDAADAQR